MLIHFWRLIEMGDSEKIIRLPATPRVWQMATMQSSSLDTRGGFCCPGNGKINALQVGLVPDRVKRSTIEL